MRARNVLPETINPNNSGADTGARAFAIRIDHNDMMPALRRGTVVYLGERGRFWGADGLCVLPDSATDRPSQDVRWFAWTPTGTVLLWTGNVDAAIELSAQAWRDLGPWPVTGYSVPLSPEFSARLKERFEGGRQ
jgi:hypothetical protein